MKRYSILVILILFTSSCGGDSTLSYEDVDSHTLTLTTQTELIIEDTNGSVTITGSDTTDILSCTISKKVTSNVSEDDARSHISDIEVTVNNDANTVKYEVAHPSSDNISYEVNFDIVLPNNFNHTITLDNGDITLQSATTTVNVDLLNGTCTADLFLSETCDVLISIGNGEIALTLPDSTNANLAASVVNGAISNTGLTFTDQQTSSTLFTGTLGTGNGNIALSVVNGHVEMIKK